MRPHIIFALAVLCAASVASSQQLLVFPAVTDELPGANDSLWVTVVKIVKLDPRDTVTVRRKWVCLPGGGFEDDPATAPSWTLSGGTHRERFLLKWGRSLLGDTGSRVGAVALEVSGGEVVPHAYVADVSRGEHLPLHWSFGQGQLIAASRLPLSGQSHIPWLGGCTNLPCNLDPPVLWNYLRNNVGFVNPNPEPLTITGSNIAFSARPDWEISEVAATEPDTFIREVPPFGWMQFHWVSSAGYYGTDDLGGPVMPKAGFILNLTPDKDLPYYAYASVVFSPDPASGIPAFSDPMYVPAEPGYVPAMTEVPEP